MSERLEEFSLQLVQWRRHFRSAPSRSLSAAVRLCTSRYAMHRPAGTQWTRLAQCSTWTTCKHQQVCIHRSSGVTGQGTVDVPGPERSFVDERRVALDEVGAGIQPCLRVPGSRHPTDYTRPSCAGGRSVE